MKLRFAHIAVIGALTAVFALGGCGRKGMLDPPPGTVNPQPLPGERRAATNPFAVRQAAKPAEAPASFDTEGRPIASSGVKRSLPMDWLID